MRKWIGLALIPMMLGCQDESSQADGPDPLVLSLETSILKSLQEAVATEDNLPGASITVFAPTIDLRWSGSAGHRDLAKQEYFTFAHPIRISSVTKTFVAASILRLYERGLVDLDAPMSAYLTERHSEIVRQGPYDPDQITVRHLLTHTSGIVDIFDTKPFADYFASVIAGGEPKKFTLEGQIEGAVLGGEPTSGVGERQLYTDTGYILLGAILENLTGKDMAAATIELSGYGEMNLRDTWWGIYQAPSTNSSPRAKQFYGDFDGDSFGEEPFDLFGGGGMISSSYDLATYFWALFHDEVFDDPATLTIMKSKPQVEQISEQGPVLGHGLQHFDFDGYKLFGHTGWWGVGVYYSPEHDVLVSINWLQQMSGGAMSERAKSIVLQVVRAVESKSEAREAA